MVESVMDVVPTPVLRLQQLGHCFGRTRVLSGVSLDVLAGECLAIIGPNGAGKSTLFNLISGALKPTQGQVFLHGQNVTGWPAAQLARQGVARGFQVGQLFPRLNALDHLRVAAAWHDGHGYRLGRLWSRQRASTQAALQWLKRLGLAARAQVPTAQLSYAEQRTLDVGMALASNAQVLLLDEPTAGMSRSETRAFLRLLRAVTPGKTVLLVEHDMDVVFELADRVAVLVRGELLACDAPAAVRENTEVKKAYLSSPPAPQKMSPPAPPAASPPRGGRYRPTGEAGSVASPDTSFSAPGTGLVVRGLCAGYGLGQVLHGVDVAVGAGEVVALLGRNGSGRSTLAQAVMGLLPTGGTMRGAVSWRGQAVAGLPPHRIARLGLGYVPESRDVFPHLSVRDNLRLGQAHSRVGVAPLWDEAAVWALFPTLHERADVAAGALSGGEQQMLSLARCLMGNPSGLIVDEPTEGLAPHMVAQVAAVLERLRAQGVAVLLVEQKLNLALTLADRVLVLGQSRVVFAGSPSELAARDDVRRQWLEVGASERVR